MEGKGEALREDVGAFTWKEVILEHKGQLGIELGVGYAWLWVSLSSTV